MHDHNKQWFEGRIEIALQASSDIERDTRLEIMECPYCFYFGSKIGGSAVTGWSCLICKKGSISGSTNCPLICQDCAKKENKCIYCSQPMFEVKEIENHE